MCGIAGIFGEGARDRAVLARMGAALTHRGPDGHDLWIDPDAGIGFAHRRLAVVDLSPAGHQPMHSHEGQLVLNFNGEIFNHAEIRAQVERAGGTPESGWRGHSDTETLVEAIALWGVRAALKKCVGQFAFALWDRKERRLSLVRDRFGEKPLYYGWAGRDLLFGSELKALRCHRAFDAAIDRQALALFTSRGYVPAPLSIYRGIFKLEPGCLLELTEAAPRSPLSAPPRPGTSAGGLLLSRYWSYRELLHAGLDDPIRDEGEALEALDAALIQAVADQSMADVPVGAFLSGGVDSSTVVAYYQRQAKVPVRTFTIGFTEAAFNEADDARAVARHLGTEHHERLVTASEAADVVPLLPGIYDEPFADSSQIPTFLVSRFAREQVTVALSGDGGDELFGGYNRYFGTARLWSRLGLLPRPVRGAAAAAAGAIPASAWQRLGELVLRGEALPHFGAKVRRSLRAAAAGSEFEQQFASYLDEWAEEGSPVLGTTDGASSGFDLNLGREAPDALRMMYCDSLSYLPDDILCKVDRASMAVSLEARVPFLDHRVAAVAARIPLTMKIRGNEGKHILRRLLYRHAPAELFDRPKAGFAAPVGAWLKGPLRDWAEDLLQVRGMTSEGWFDVEMVRRRWKDHIANDRDSASALWPILMFQAWLRTQSSEALKSELTVSSFGAVA